MRALLRYGLILGLICLVATGLLAIVNRLTLPQITIQLNRETEKSLKEVLPEAASFEPVRQNNGIIYYRALNGTGGVIGAAFKASGKGYSSVIETMVGMKKDGTINAIKVLAQNETPGLGSRITEIKDDTTIFDFIKGKKQDTAEKPWFGEQFSGKDIRGLSGIQAITGATISSQAVIDSVKEKTQEIKRLLNGN
ncbi:MAG: RnfABCDGE type electron transport complex subunit G [Candidatus Omnitrophica bacterium]|jgi:electron transport complex protein RnfG|nr:RnfABCDGE type electron transport complex subunit G [Candidatus Omnitrophota bacterium]MDD5079609.1 RnfABCDGE type electron transport complex subunit G [Candidatus Omnitrophota bacterium]